jgi:hypothetical protein
MHFREAQYLETNTMISDSTSTLSWHLTKKAGNHPLFIHLVSRLYPTRLFEDSNLRGFFFENKLRATIITGRIYDPNIGSYLLTGTFYTQTMLDGLWRSVCSTICSRTCLQPVGMNIA